MDKCLEREESRLNVGMFIQKRERGNRSVSVCIRLVVSFFTT